MQKENKQPRLAIDISVLTFKEKVELTGWASSICRNENYKTFLLKSIETGTGYLHYPNAHNIKDDLSDGCHFKKVLTLDGYQLTDFDTFANEYIRPKVDKSKPKVIGYELPGDYGPLRKGARSTEIIGSEVWFNDSTGFSHHIPLWNAQKAFIPIYEQVEPTAWDVWVGIKNDKLWTNENELIYKFNATFELKGNDEARKNTATAKE